VAGRAALDDFSVERRVWGNGLTLAMSSVTPASTVTVAGPSKRYVNVASVAIFASGSRPASRNLASRHRSTA